MPDIRYVCLSDTHFGADNSLLTNIRPNTITVDPLRPSPVLESFVACLTEIISKNESNVPPTLVLNGDILELALTTDNNAAMAFERFMELIVPRGGKPLFANEIVYIPGNHDHHLWETARESQYANFIKTNPTIQFLPVPWHTTNMFASDAVPSVFLDAVIQRHETMKDIHVRTVYPNFGLKDGLGKAVIFSHGHFIESMYMLMTSLRSMIFPTRKGPTTVWDLEAENFAWIDFFWSTMGRSGDIGSDFELVYNMLTDAQKMKVLIDALAAGVVGQLGKFVSLTKREKDNQTKLIDLALGHVAEAERLGDEGVLGAASAEGLKTYVEGILLAQLELELNQTRPTDCSIIFGHTHKPFEDVRQFAGYPQNTNVYNSGGWVIDTPDIQPLQGASAILVDEDLNVVSLRFYNQGKDRSQYSVSVNQAMTANMPYSPFAHRLQGLIDPQSGVWKTFSDVVCAEIPPRLKNVQTMGASAS